MTQRILVAGGLNVDVKGAIGRTDWAMQTSNPGQIWSTLGGVGCNIAVNLAALGCDVQLAAPVGGDADGRFALTELAHAGVKVVSELCGLEGRTGRYLAVLDASGELVVAVSDMGILESFTPTVYDSVRRTCDKPAVMCLDANLREDTLQHALLCAQADGIRSLVDPVSTPKARKLLRCLDSIDLLKPNLDELAILARLPVAGIADVRSAVARLLGEGVGGVIVSMGQEGVYYRTRDDEGHVLAAELSVIDATGAGDAFSAGVIAGMAQQWTLAECVQSGQDLAARVLRSVRSTLTREDRKGT
ncbi:MAG: carbohydrate kinase family protein [Firmicutes bacterium]|nr:carbohydrate kinase family protein [Bacillota bacterium]